MSIKYIEATIIRNVEEETIFRSFSRFLGYENITKDYDTIILTFEDGSICDIKEHYVDKKFKFATRGYNTNFPIYFDLNGKTLFYKNPEIIDGKSRLNFNNIFKNFTKKDLFNMKIPSMYNAIYYMYDYKNTTKSEVDIFAVIMIKSNEENPRYLIAYDENIFDKTDVIYLINCIFKLNFDNQTEK